MNYIISAFRYIIKFPALAAAGLIVVYQKTLSPDHGLFKALYPHGYCRFYPSCSEYGKQAFLKFGFFKGFYLTVKRVLKCNPFTQPSVDAIPH